MTRRPQWRSAFRPTRAWLTALRAWAGDGSVAARPLLAGLTRAPRSLSFEFTTIQRDVAAQCLERLAALGYRAFNACLGEDMRLEHAAPLDADAMAAWIAGLPHEANSGDVYASLEPARLAR